jgi:hypothetical protein
MTSRTKGALLLVLAFALGIAAGALGLGAFRGRPGWHSPEERAHFQEAILARMTKELDLRPDQQQAIGGILREGGQEFTKLRDEMRPRFREIRSRTRDRIRSALDAPQQVKFDGMVRACEERAKHRPGPDGPEHKGP